MEVAREWTFVRGGEPRYRCPAITYAAQSLSVVAAAPGQRLDPAAVHEHATPRYMHVTDRLPRNGNLKLVRAPLRDRGLPAAAWDAETVGGEA